MSIPELSFTDHGGGSLPVVLIHGGFRRQEDWDQQVGALRDVARPITLDMPGHGRSPAAEDGCTVHGVVTAAGELLDELELGRAVLVGHSFSCRAVVELARRRPEQVVGLVLVDGSRTGGVAPGPDTIAERVRTDGPVRTARALFDNMFVSSSSPALRARLTAEAVTLPPEVMTALMVSCAEWDATEAEDALSAVACPMLAVQSTHTYPDGTRYALAEPESEWLDLLRRLVTDLSIDVVPDSGHFSMLEQPEAVSSSLRRFVAGMTAHRTG